SPRRRPLYSALLQLLRKPPMRAREVQVAETPNSPSMRLATAITEVDLGRLAERKTQNPAVKALARRLVDDHTKSNQQLMQIAQQEGMQLPSGPGKSESKQREKLQKLNGDAFDKAFVNQIVEDHQKDIKYFRKEQNSLKDAQLKSFAQQTLPV